MSLTGNPLIDARPSDWRVAVVDEIKANERHSCVAGPFGSSISSKFFVSDGVPIIRGSNLTTDLGRFVAREFAYISEETASRFSAQTVITDDLVFTCWGTIGQVGLIPSDGPYDRYVISNKQLKLRVDREVLDPLFAFYFFAAPQTVKYIKDRAIGSAVPGINLGILKALPVLLPPLETQRRIASIIGAYDDLIEVNRRRVEVLEDIARGLFEEWFVHLRFPGHEDVAIIETSCGPLPEGWLASTLGEVSNNVRTRYKATEDADLPLLDLARIPRRSSLVADFGHADQLKSSRIVAERDDILFAGIRPNLYKVVPAPTKLVTNTSVHVVRSSGTVPQSYLWACLFRDFAVAWASQHSNGTKMPTINWGVLGRFPLSIPSTGILAQFEATIQPIIDEISLTSETNQTLAASRDLLLPRLISGQLSVETAERQLEEIV